ncbi:hypothetical protein J6590_030811 [Homalodisca vitripennis]|nr:hypothetical protein J6590_030811 [Homalodisca vitripennis]
MRQESKEVFSKMTVVPSAANPIDPETKYERSVMRQESKEVFSKMTVVPSAANPSDPETKYERSVMRQESKEVFSKMTVVPSAANPSDPETKYERSVMRQESKEVFSKMTASHTQLQADTREPIVCCRVLTSRSVSRMNLVTSAVLDYIGIENNARNTLEMRGEMPQRGAVCCSGGVGSGREENSSSCQVISEAPILGPHVSHKLCPSQVLLEFP